MQNDKIVFWELRKDVAATSMHEEALREHSGKNMHYNVLDGSPDMDNLKEFKVGMQLPFVGIIYTEEVSDGKTKRKPAQVCAGKMTRITPQRIDYRVLTELTLDLMYENIRRLAILDLEKDFAEKNYMLLERSAVIAEQVASYVNEPNGAFDCNKSKKGKPSLVPSDSLRACGPIDCFDEKAPEYRKDIIAITNSRAFRRTVDKAQIFGADKGDHYRTRMTHTQVVTQIALALARRLKLDEDLTEAIALGHDIGHTPFGHQGERTLDDILRGKGYSIIRNVELLGSNFMPKREGETNYELKKSNFRFKHNYQSLRIASTEETSFNYRGLNLCIPVLEGMLKHTDIKPGEFELADFTEIPSDKLHFDTSFASTLEGQAVAMADEIAQRAHDLDDALLSGEFSLDAFRSCLNLRRFNTLRNKIISAVDKLEKYKDEGFTSHNDTRLAVGVIVREFTEYFVDAAVENAKRLLARYPKTEPLDKNYLVFSGDEDDDIIGKGEESAVEMATGGPSKKTSANVKEQNDYIASLIKARVVINNREVAVFDSNAASIVSGLFKAYYENPRLLPAGTKRVLYARLREAKVPDGGDGKPLVNIIDFITGDDDLVRSEYDKMTTLDLSDLTRDHSAEREKLLMEYRTKRRVLVRTICDYIAGMTDSFARAEYARLVPNIAKLQTDYSKESGKKA